MDDKLYRSSALSQLPRKVGGDADNAVDLGNFARPDYYWAYNSPKFNDLFNQIKNAARPADRAKLLGDAQRLLAEDSVHAFLYSNQWITVANKNLKGLWKDMPVFVNDISSLSWS